MFVGHAALAFAIAAVVARWRGWSPERALSLGLLAAGFATLPDIDMLYAPLGLLDGVEGLGGASAAFWDAAAEVHRSTTHSHVVGVVAAAAFASWRWAVAIEGWRRPAGGLLSVALLLFLVLVGAFTTGPVAGFVLLAFALGGLVLVGVAGRLDLGAGAVLGASLLGLLSHPFGDLVTGGPPAVLYPFDLRLFHGPVVIHGDPTLNLLGAFFLELATLWFALIVLARLRGWRLRVGVRRRAGLGVGYAWIVLAVPAPSLETPTLFVVSVLALGLLGAPVRLDGGSRPRLWPVVTTALSAITVAGLAYCLAYLAVG